VLKSRIAHITLAMVAMAGLTAGPANASSAAAEPFRTFIVRGIYLAAESTGTASLPYSDDSEWDFTIDTAGDYTWSDYFTTYGPTSQRTLYLAAGNYAWGCEIIGTGVSGSVGDNYELTCWLDDLSAPSDPTAYLPSGSAVWKVDLPANTYTWYTSIQN
jgi:hypothetical protein